MPLAYAGGSGPLLVFLNSVIYTSDRIMLYYNYDYCVLEPESRRCRRNEWGIVW